MPIRTLICLVGAIALSPAHAGAQNATGGSGTSQYAPNSYSRNTQPLSPYLNLMRGNNSAVNYYYGVRPGSAGGPLGSPFSVGTGAQGRQTFFPQVDTLYEPEGTKPTDGIRATGHPFGFNNGLGYFGSGTSQQQRSGARKGTGLK